MKKIITLFLAVAAFSGCQTVDKLLLTKSGQDDPATEEIDESVALNPIIEAAKPIASVFPYGELAYGAIITAAGAYAEIRRRKTKSAAKATAIAIEKLVSSDLGKDGTKLVKNAVRDKAREMGVEKEINKIVKEIS